MSYITTPYTSSRSCSTSDSTRLCSYIQFTYIPFVAVFIWFLAVFPFEAEVYNPTVIFDRSVYDMIEALVSLGDTDETSLYPYGPLHVLTP